MRQYECRCLCCNRKRQCAFPAEPYPKPDEIFPFFCKACQRETEHTRVLTRKTLAAQRRTQAEAELREAIAAKCAEYGFSCWFLHQSVVVNTPISDWCFDYHLRQVTLYHESTRKISRRTGNPAKYHVQFSHRKMTFSQVIDYIAVHDGAAPESSNA